MVPKITRKSKLRPVYKLRDQEAFEWFIANSQFAVIVVYHYVCPECDSYLKQLRRLAAEYKKDERLSFGKIHIQLEWMIREAKLKGDVEEENTFLVELDVGKKVPATLFYNNGKLKWKLEGVLPPPIFRGLIKKLQESTEKEG
ncbi:MAG: thioredoxin family protein [Thermoplasmata archaeon]|nr:MAG: thioredoxin family protein [Thermoplasmata archaeon]